MKIMTSLGNIYLRLVNVYHFLDRPFRALWKSLRGKISPLHPAFSVTCPKSSGNSSNIMTGVPAEISAALDGHVHDCK